MKIGKDIFKPLFRNCCHISGAWEKYIYLCPEKFFAETYYTLEKKSNSSTCSGSILGSQLPNHIHPSHTLSVLYSNRRRPARKPIDINLRRSAWPDTGNYSHLLWPTYHSANTFEGYQFIRWVESTSKQARWPAVHQKCLQQYSIAVRWIILTRFKRFW